MRLGLVQCCVVRSSLVECGLVRFGEVRMHRGSLIVRLDQDPKMRSGGARYGRVR